MLSLVFVSLWFGVEEAGFTLEHSDKRLFNLHPLLMIIGPISCSSFAGTIFKSFQNSELRGDEATRQRLWLKRVHLCLHLVSLCCMGVGVYIVFQFHAANQIKHFYSLHSWLGLLSVGCFCLLYVPSFGIFHYPQGTELTRARLIQQHKKLGLCLLFVLLPVVSVSGILEKLTFEKACTVAEADPQASTMNMRCLYGNLLGVMIVCVSVLSLFIVLRKV